MGGKAGVAAALEAVGPGGLAAEAEQLPLLQAPASSSAVDLVQAERRGPGRPPGARNRTTDAWVRHLTAVYGSPLEELLRMGFDPKVPREERRDCLKAALPYMHQQLPKMVEIEDRRLPTVVIMQPEGGRIVVDQAVVDAVITDLTCEEDQGLSDGDDAAVERERSNASSEGEADQGLGEAEPLIADQPGGAS